MTTLYRDVSRQELMRTWTGRKKLVRVHYLLCYGRPLVREIDATQFLFRNKPKVYIDIQWDILIAKNLLHMATFFATSAFHVQQRIVSGEYIVKDLAGTFKS